MGNWKVDIRDIQIRFHAYPIRFHRKGWKLKGNRKTNIPDIQIHFHTYLICFHLYDQPSSHPYNVQLTTYQ